MEPDLQSIWQDYGLEELQKGLDELFPQYRLSLQSILEKVLTGDILSIVGDIFLTCSEGIIQQFTSLKSIFIWLLLLGIAASLMTHFAEVFNKHQISDLSYYFMYLLLSTILFKCFMYISDISAQILDNMVRFAAMAIPAFLLSVGVATGTTTVGAYSQLFLWIIYGVQKVLGSWVFKFVTVYVILALLNGIWIEERLGLLVEFIKKVILFVLKAALWAVTGISVFQTLITPVIDSAKSSVLQKVVSAVPGIGNVSEGIWGMVLGSAVIIKNSIGIVVLILLLVVCAIPLFQVFAMAVMLRLAAAVLGIISDKRLVECTNKVGDGCMLLLRVAATSIALFFIVISVLALATNRGY